MADEKIKISELESASQSEFTDDALLVLDVEDQNSATGFSTKSGLLSRLVAYIKTKLTAADIPYSSGVSVADKLDSLSNYSSTETVIGEWIDNKPIYRKVLTGTISSNALVFGIGCDVDNVINLRCYLKKTNNLIFSIPYRNEVSANEYYQAYVFVNDTTNNNEVAILCSSSNADYFNGSSVIAIVEYTKA